MDSLKTVHDLLIWLMAIMSSIGILVNFCMLVVFLRKGLRKLSISIYYQVISLINVLLLLLLIRKFITDRFNILLFKIVSQISCKLIEYLVYCTGPVSSWIEILVSIDRYVKIVYPNKFGILFKKPFQIITIVFIIVVNFIYYSYSAVKSSIVYSNAIVNASNIQKDCWIKDQISSWMDLSNYMAQLLIMLSGSLLLIFHIRKSRSRFIKSSTKKKSLSKDTKFAVATISLNILFLVTNFPNVFIMAIIYSFNLFSLEIQDLLANFTILLYNFYYAFYFLFLIFVNKIVRAEFREMFNFSFNK